MARMPGTLTLLVALCGLVGPAPAGAAGGVRHDPPGYYARPVDRDSGKGGRSGGDHDERGEARVSLDQAVSMVRSRYDGKVIRAETHYSDGRPVHHIRILTPEGRVYTVRVDGVSGRTQ
jgi:hypothetical protein